MVNQTEDSLGPRGLTAEQQRKIAAIQSQAATNSLQTSYERFSVDRIEPSLYVGELEPEVNDEILKRHFRTAKSVHVCRDRVSGKSLGYAYVNFYRSEDCLEILQNINYSLINGRPCRIMMAERDVNKRSINPGNLFVKNLPPTADDKSLHDTFAQWGNVISCRVIKNPNGSKCYGYVNYDTYSAAERAIEMVNGAYLFGREIQVSHQVPKTDREVVDDTSKQRFTNVYVKNIPLEINEEELRVLFSSLGPVSSLLIQRDENNQSKGFGFVNYESPEDAEKAVHRFHDYDYRGKRLFVSRAQKKSEREDELRRQHEYQHLRTEKQTKYQGVNLYVKNLADDVDDELLKNEFSGYGHITSAKVMKDERTGISKGFGFVCFTSPEEATEAVIRMNGHKISSKEIYVALAQRKEDRRTLLEAQMTQKPYTAESSPTVFSASSIESYSPEIRRQMLGEKIYGIISDIYPNEANQLTQMLLQIDESKLIHLVNDQSQLKAKADVLKETL